MSSHTSPIHVVDHKGTQLKTKNAPKEQVGLAEEEVRKSGKTGLKSQYVSLAEGKPTGQAVATEEKRAGKAAGNILTSSSRSEVSSDDGTTYFAAEPADPDSTHYVDRTKVVVPTNPLPAHLDLFSNDPVQNKKNADELMRLQDNAEKLAAAKRAKRNKILGVVAGVSVLTIALTAVLVPISQTIGFGGGAGGGAEKRKAKGFLAWIKAAMQGSAADPVDFDIAALNKPDAMTAAPAITSVKLVDPADGMNKDSLDGGWNVVNNHITFTPGTAALTAPATASYVVNGDGWDATAATLTVYPPVQNILVTGTPNSTAALVFDIPGKNAKFDGAFNLVGTPAGWAVDATNKRITFTPAMGIAGKSEKANYVLVKDGVTSPQGELEAKYEAVGSTKPIVKPIAPVKLTDWTQKTVSIDVATLSGNAAFKGSVQLKNASAAVWSAGTDGKVTFTVPTLMAGVGPSFTAQCVLVAGSETSDELTVEVQLVPADVELQGTRLVATVFDIPKVNPKLTINTLKLIDGMADAATVGVPGAGDWLITTDRKVQFGPYIGCRPDSVSIPYRVVSNGFVSAPGQLTAKFPRTPVAWAKQVTTNSLFAQVKVDLSDVVVIPEGYSPNDPIGLYATAGKPGEATKVVGDANSKGIWKVEVPAVGSPYVTFTPQGSFNTSSSETVYYWAKDKNGDQSPALPFEPSITVNFG